MRHHELPRLVEALKPPIATFVRESHVRLALLISGSGQVLAQHGFTRSYEVMNVASLAAAAHAAAGGLAEMSGVRRWTHLHHAGQERQLFVAPIRTPVGELILVAIFDQESSLGIVQLFFDQLARTVNLLPEFQQPIERPTAASFERDLEAGLQRVLPEAGEA